MNKHRLSFWLVVAVMAAIFAAALYGLLSSASPLTCETYGRDAKGEVICIDYILPDDADGQSRR